MITDSKLNHQNQLKECEYRAARQFSRVIRVIRVIRVGVMLLWLLRKSTFRYPNYEKKYN